SSRSAAVVGFRSTVAGRQTDAVRSAAMLRPALGIALLVAGSVGAAPLDRLEYRDDRLTIRARDTPVGEVVDALKRQSGAEVRGAAPEGAVRAELDTLPLRE